MGSRRVVAVLLIAWSLPLASYPAQARDAGLARVARDAGLAAPPASEGRAPTGRVATPDADAWTAIVGRLAAADLAGRGLGEPGLELAAAYLAQALRDAGLQPLFGDSYADTVGVQRTRPWKGPARLRLGDTELSPGVDFVPLRAGGAGTAEAPIVFAGYGLRLPDAGYDDYAGLDVRGAIVLALRHEPAQEGTDAAFLGALPLRAADPDRKAALAADLGAAAFVLVNDPVYVASHASEDVPVQIAERPFSVGIPCLSVSWKAARPALAGLGLDLTAEQAAIDTSKRPRSRALAATGAVQADVVVDDLPLVNLGGWVPGAPRRPWTIVGAHYDHLGRVAGANGGWYPGADDNASGVATALLLARDLAARPSGAHDGPVAFVFFTGEEAGSLGSEAFTTFPPFPLEQVGAYVNLDQVGRLRADGRFVALGVGSSPGWPALLDRARAGSRLHPSRFASGFGPSDQAPFAEAGVPVLHLYTGVTREQHTPDDTPERLDVAGALEILGLAHRLVDALRSEEPLPRVRPGPRPGTDGSPPNGSAPPGEWGLRLELAWEGSGAKVAGVEPASSAERAGLRAGDLIVAWEQRPVASAADLARALQLTWPTREARVTVHRGGSTLELTLPPARSTPTPW